MVDERRTNQMTGQNARPITMTTLDNDGDLVVPKLPHYWSLISFIIALSLWRREWFKFRGGRRA